MSSEGQDTRVDFYGIPAIRRGPECPPYRAPPSKNPVLRGLLLVILASIATKLNLVGSFLWSNTGFGLLRQIRELDDYEPRYDPTVIKLFCESKSRPAEGSTSGEIDVRDPKSSRRHYGAAYYTSTYTDKTLTPTQVTTGLLDRISAKKHHSLAFLQIIPEHVLAAAEASTARYKAGKPLGPLDGVPVAVKDEVDLDGYEKSLGSPINFTRKDGGTSWCVKKWEDAGALIIGKLNMHELGLDTTNNNPTKGTPLNPHNPSYYTGGSSGGSAYVVASGLIPIALGADGGGSIRIPSTYCGLYGLKPTHGRISIAPTIALAVSNGVVGPMASNMADLELAYRVLATPDPSNPVSSLFQPPSPPSSSPPPPRRDHQKRILGIYKSWLSTPACDNAIEHYTSLGYSTVEISLPYLHEAQLAHALTILTEISTGLPPSALPFLTPPNKILISVGHQTPSSDFLLAQKMRNMLMQHLAWLWKEHPGMLIVSPTTPNDGWRIEDADLKQGVSDADMSLRSMRYVWLANFTGCPALSIPVGMVEPTRGRGEGKIPVGMMAMAEWGDEEGLMEWGRDGEEWAWREGEEKVTRAKGWEDAREWLNG